MAKLELCIIRHADAVDADGKVITTDGQRPLSHKGEQQARLLGKALASIEWIPDLVLHSPLVRTTQTAELMAAGAKKLGVKWDTEPLNALTSGYGAPAAVRALEKREYQGRIALVGHMPEVAELAAWLLGANGGSLHFPKAAAMLLTCPLGIAEGLSRLLWFTGPVWHELAD